MQMELYDFLELIQNQAPDGPDSATIPVVVMLDGNAFDIRSVELDEDEDRSAIRIKLWE